MKRAIVLTSLFFAVGSLGAQFPAGFRDLSFANVTGVGSDPLRSRVHYPAQSAGQDVPLLARAGGWPVVVFLHGAGLLGQQYTELGNGLASAGFIAAMMDTGATDFHVMNDGIAHYASLQALNATTGHFLEGALDLSRAAVVSHSAGSRALVGLLARNPGYRCGVTMAPAYNRGQNAAPLVETPLATIHGRGDAVVGWQRGRDLFDETANVDGLGVFYLLNGDCDHTNVVGLQLGNATDRAVWEHCERVMIGFIEAYALGDPAGLENVVGPAARAEPRFDSLVQRVEAPAAWRVGSTAPNARPSVRVLGQPGPAVLLLAAATANIPTPLGPLLLDPATLLGIAHGTAGADGLMLRTLAVPNDQSLVGQSFPLQGVGLGSDGNPRTTNRVDLLIE